MSDTEIEIRRGGIAIVIAIPDELKERVAIILQSACDQHYGAGVMSMSEWLGVDLPCSYDEGPPVPWTPQRTKRVIERLEQAEKALSDYEEQNPDEPIPF